MDFMIARELTPSEILGDKPDKHDDEYLRQRDVPCVTC